MDVLEVGSIGGLTAVKSYHLGGTGDSLTHISQEPASHPIPAHRSTVGVGDRSYLHRLVQRGCGHPGQGPPKATVHVCDGEGMV